MQVYKILEEAYKHFNQPAFIENDPICIPHSFTGKQDREIAGFFAATLAWGQRKVIIRKCRELLQMMDNAPYHFVKNFQETDLKPFLQFKQRTFNADDNLYFLHFLQFWYKKHESLEEAFVQEFSLQEKNIEKALIHFEKTFFSLPFALARTRKHIPTPTRKSTCKRLCMFLRWMVRKDKNGVDFGIWQKIKPSQLVCPCDVHTERTARALGLITRKSTDWLAALELTENLRKFCPQDPVKYDFALFGLSEKGNLRI
ncbi:TIGR02757 family protein [Raineya orbicola]|jgi:uncharacterized protein (TIGR02757 family)|uniref:TIGR02757 family protein n=1 Tax=Raineya orbicola TaxID=2016530 RepID=A0A2N3ICI6_9BACT|nr:TIGR02757 family protein [Raineya orbicola]PKQ68062.1 hypothetical protein Rain11_1789 [Raineya orbicola]